MFKIAILQKRAINAQIDKMNNLCSNEPPVR